MSELLLHFAVPFAAFSYFRRPREAFAASLIALLPDVDALIRVHRSWTHSIVVVLAACGVVLLLIRAFRPRLLGFGLLATLGLVSHLLLDLFTTYTPILWPLVGWSIFVSLDGGVHISKGLNFNLGLKVSTRTTDFAPFTVLDAPIFTSEGFIIASVLIASALLSRYSKALKGLFREGRR